MNMDTLSSSPGLDWNLCIFCQKNLRSKTRCPAKSNRTDVGSGYASLEKDVANFKNTGKFPPGLNINSWDDGDGIAATCQRHSACWHIQCRNVLHPTTIERHLKRGDIADDDFSDSGMDLDNQQTEQSFKVPRLTRSLDPISNPFDSKCFSVRKRKVNLISDK